MTDGSTAEQRLSELERDLGALLANERALRTSPSPTSLAEQILKQAIAATAADAGSVFLREERSGRLLCLAALGDSAEALRSYALPAGRGVVGAVAESGRPILTRAEEDPRHDRVTAARLEFPVEGILCVPVVDGTATIGVIEVLTRKGSDKHFDGADLKLLELMASQAARALQAARAMEERMKAQRLEALALVIRGVVHDVRNPLTFINGYAEMIAEEPDPAAREKGRDAIYRNVEDINEMLHELADFTGGGDTLKVRPSDLHAIAEDVVRQFQSKAMNSKRILRARRRGDGRGNVDPAKIRRVIANLVKNAIEATPIDGRITVSSFRGSDGLYVTVRDTGKGVPPEVLPRIFEPFVTHGKRGGTGLGLSICQRFAEQHGGEIGCRTQAGRGTRFVIRLPA